MSWALVAACVIAAGGGAARALPNRGPRVALDFGFGFVKNALGDGFVWSPLVELGAPVSPDWSFVARWGFAGAPADGGTAFETGNPAVGFSFRASEGFTLTPIITLPLARGALNVAAGDPQAPRALAYEAARAVRGGVDPWLWVPNTVSPALLMTWARWFDPVLLEVHPDLSYIVPISGSGSRTGFVIQLRARAALRLFRHLWIGATTALVVTPADAKGAFQFSVGGELRFTVGSDAFVGTRLVTNIGGALGTSFYRDDAYWGLHLDVGAGF